MACVISGEERKDEMKTEKKKKNKGRVKKVKGGIHPCLIKGREEVVVRRTPAEFGQDDGDDGTTLGRKPATNSATADQYPGCTHVSSTQAQ